MKNLVCGILALLLGAVYMIEAGKIPQSALSDGVGASGLPMLIAGSLIVIAIFMIAQSGLDLVLSRRARAEEDTAPGVWAEPGRAARRAAGLVAIGIAFLVLMPVIGYLLALMLMLPAVAIYQGKRPGFEVFATAVGGAVALWILFVWILDIPLPAGIFEDLF